MINRRRSCNCGGGGDGSAHRTLCAFGCCAGIGREDVLMRCNIGEQYYFLYTAALAIVQRGNSKWTRMEARSRLLW